ncbi:type VI secretion system ATPase TssH [Pseudomonas sp. 148P]|uniref:Type VI secretion system ATPase TssH n=1 Tax=Pseudomonas ulcerans TaxID=3115852 RepID=A0ABU7HUJ6_9PSED|nr:MULTISPECIES: type VI secretion system ATPase TssH [unclassified Pseudomonas]MEE1924015.1 type VI secretion system ATPase TssH [Pseudomonas sp. 147P]MEE1935222.1 type VI secretion system ATPase TssH [Pseudomonas sp. 148P]
MINVDLQHLVQAMDAASKADLERSAERCLHRGGHKILIEDLLLGLLERPDGLLRRGLQDAGIEAGELARLLQVSNGHSESRNPVFAPELVQWLQDALLLATVELRRPCIDEAALLLSLLGAPMRHAGTRYQPLLSRLDTQRLRDHALANAAPPTSVDSAVSLPADSALQRFTHDLTQRARDGKLDPVLCRDNEIRQMIDVLARRRKNNPIVVAEAGVGKTALVEGLALRIIADEVPDALRQVRLLALDLGLLQAGASIKGEFERRLQGVIDEVKSATHPVILFIDEAHTLIGAGAQAGSSDAANLLKPALARGELRTIAATTWSEYKKYFEKDPALARRFQPIQLHEPRVDEAITILRGLAPVYEQSHGVYLRDDAVVAAAELSARYLSGRQLPDKAVDVLDTACARVRISLAAAPEALERLRNERAEGERHCRALQRDLDAGLPVDTQALQALHHRLEEVSQATLELETQWTLQRDQARRLLDLRQRCAALRQSATRDGVADPELNELENTVRDLQASLAHAQREQRLVSHEVCPRLVAEVISHWTGVPLAQLAREHSQAVADFAPALQRRLLGQPQAVQALDRAMRASAAGLGRRDAPAGVFLLVGPSGVGKTETAHALADLLYGGERFLTTINMTEFQEKHSVSRLIGSPPGYVGYGEGGMLTEAVRQKPYSVLLLDEVEKADPDVLNLFYQIFDKGVVNDGEGREISLRNTLILMTSNLASEQITALCSADQQPCADALEQAIQPTLSRHFKPALLARMRVVPYFPVSGQVLHDLVRLKLQRFAERLAQRQLAFTHAECLVEHLAGRCAGSDSGARLIDHLLDQHLQPLVVDRLLAAIAGGEPVDRVHACLDSQGAITCEFA